jgi:ribonuclease J
MAELVFYGGVNEIGGNKILLTNKETKILLDFGQNFEKESSFFHYPYLAPREEKHLLSLNILPKIPGIYKCDNSENSEIQGVLISHGHADHTNYIRYLKPEIDVYCTELTNSIMIARELSKPMYPAEYSIARLTQKRGEEILYKINELAANKSERIGTFEINSIETDHSIPGSCGYVITSSEGSVIYTGDLRFHGTRQDASRQFIEEAAKIKPDALIIEGTNIVNAKVTTENDVFTETKELVSKSNHLAMVTFSTVDIDRLNTFYDVAQKTGRKLTIPIKMAFLIHRLSSKLKTLDLKDPDVYIFRRHRETTYEWEKQILDNYSNVKSCEEIEKEQDRMIMVTSFHDMNEMCEIKPNTGSFFIESQSEPFNEEMELDHDRLLNWLECYGLPSFNIHSSGHAFPHDLKEAIQKISPKKVFLVHTERPRLYAEFIRDIQTEIITPTLGEKYSVQ